MEALQPEEKRITTSVALPPELKRQIKEYGKAHGLSMAGAICFMVSTFLSDNYRKTIESHQKTEGNNS